jgi:hypothetical protein
MVREDRRLDEEGLVERITDEVVQRYRQRRDKWVMNQQQCLSVISC